MIYIGIDAGTKTGVAIWDASKRAFEMITSMPIHKAMEVVHERIKLYEVKTHVRVEDARKRTWYGNKMSFEKERGKLQGVGSIKRDCTIWDEFLNDIGASYEMVAPKRNVTKLTQDQFKKITGYGKRTSEHARDAAMLVYGF